MRKRLLSVIATLAAFMPTLALAEEIHSYSRGNAFVYYTVIAVVLIYGIHDTFRTRWATWTSAVVIPLVFYFLFLPSQ